MKEKKQKKILPSENQNKPLKKADPKHQQEQENLFSKADAISPANKKIDEDEIVHLQGGTDINISEYIRENYAQASTHYFKTFYLSLADLFGVDPKVMVYYRKPHFVPVFKNSFIYARFPQRVVDRMHEKNPYISYCKRRYKNYQCLTIKADEELREYIWQAHTMIDDCSSVKEFIIAYCTKYSLPIQLDLFDNLLAK